MYETIAGTLFGLLYVALVAIFLIDQIVGHRDMNRLFRNIKNNKPTVKKDS